MNCMVCRRETVCWAPLQIFEASAADPCLRPYFSDNFLCLFERTPGVDLYDEALGFAGAVERFLVGQQPFHPRSKPQIVSGISALEGGGEGLSAAIDGANIAHKEAKRSIALPALCLMKHSKTRWRAPSVCRRTCRRRWNGSSSLFICSPR